MIMPLLQASAAHDSAFASADVLAAHYDTYVGCQSALVAPTARPHVNHLGFFSRPLPHCSMVLPFILSAPKLHAMFI